MLFGKMLDTGWVLPLFVLPDDEEEKIIMDTLEKRFEASIVVAS